jgi:hypothetical protein
MARGPAGYGRYDDDPGHVGCPFAKSDMTPCIARDGRIALAGDPPDVCVGCAHDPGFLLIDLASEYGPAREHDHTGDPQIAADRFAELVRAATEPATEAK